MSRPPARERDRISADSRKAILHAALDLLVTEGPKGLTVRRVATDAGCSTIGIYTWFGGKDGLVDAIWTEGFTSFSAALRRASKSGDDPIVRLRAQANAYRRWGLRHPAHYRVMFMGAIAGHVAGDEAMTAAAGAFSVLRDLVAEAVDRGHLAGDADELALGFWGIAHGLVSLQIVNERPSHLRASSRVDDAVFERSITALIDGLQTRR